MKLDTLNIEEKMGQRFIFGVNNSNINDIIKLVKYNYVGGVILYRKNYSSYDSMLKVIKELKLANKNNKVPLFIAVDQEGGVVNRFPREIKRLKNIYDISKVNRNLVKDYAKVISDILLGLGINMNFAPVVDIYNGSKSKVLLHRCFYGDTEEVTSLAKEYIDATTKGVISVIKHFPGHGATTFDTHFLIPYVFSKKEIMDRHIRPFDKLINDVDAVMVGHLVINGLTGILPASIANNFLYQYFRKEKKYNNLIVTDELNMLKRHLIYRFYFMNKAIKSCNDLLLVKIKNYNEGVRIIEKYKRIIVRDKKYMDLLDESVFRILSVKDKYGINDNIDRLGINIDKINIEIERINGELNAK